MQILEKNYLEGCNGFVIEKGFNPIKLIKGCSLTEVVQCLIFAAVVGVTTTILCALLKLAVEVI